MENDIIDSLNDIGYEGPLTDESAFLKALEGGPKSLEFTKLVHILAAELKRLCNLEETVNMMNDPDESNTFLLELSSILKELGCPYKKLVIGHMSSRLQSKEDRILLLDYLLSELMAARMVNVDKPKDSGMEIVMQESPTAKDLKDILIALKFNKPPPNITIEMLFSKLELKLKETIQKEGDKLVGKPLYNKSLTEKQWRELEDNFADMLEDYRLRRETLITRLECTIQSFEWSDRLKGKKDLIQATYRPKRSQMKVKPGVRLSDFLAARTSLLQVEKTSSAAVRKNTQSEVNKLIIGQVPDRGGRPNEQQPPPPEMPSWQQRVPGGGGGRGGGGRGGGSFAGGGGGVHTQPRRPTITRRQRLSATTRLTKCRRVGITTAAIIKEAITRVVIIKVAITRAAMRRVMEVVTISKAVTGRVKAVTKVVITKDKATAAATTRDTTVADLITRDTIKGAVAVTNRAATAAGAVGAATRMNTTTATGGAVAAVTTTGAVDDSRPMCGRRAQVW